MSLNDRVNDEVVKKLAALHQVSPRSPEKAVIGRAEFLKEAQSIARTVSKPEERRPNRWMGALQSLFVNSRKEHSPMVSPLAMILIVMSLLFGGSGLTVAGAQSSLPDQPLYGLKLLSEEARLILTSSAETKLQLQLEFADRRSSEIQNLIEGGLLPSDLTQNRYQAHVEQTLQLASDMPEEQAIQAMEQIRLRLRHQQQAFLNLNPNTNPQCGAVVARIRQMLQQHLQWVEEGLADPVRLRARMRQHLWQQPQPDTNDGATIPSPVSITGMPGGSGMGGGNPWTPGTPTPGGGYGPGMGNSGGMGGNPWTEGTPTPGSSYGPGPGPMTTQSGPQPTPGMGGGGNHH